MLKTWQYLSTLIKSFISKGFLNIQGENCFIFIYHRYICKLRFSSTCQWRIYCINMFQASSLCFSLFALDFYCIFSKVWSFGLFLKHTWRTRWLKKRGVCIRIRFIHLHINNVKYLNLCQIFICSGISLQLLKKS